MNQQTKKVGIALSLIIIILIFAPWALQKAPDFNAENYYAVIGAIIGAFITLFALLWQFERENEKSEKERKRNQTEQARGFFKLSYYTNPPQLHESGAVYVPNTPECLKPYVLHGRLDDTPLTGGIVMELFSSEFIKECTVDISYNPTQYVKPPCRNIGLTMPGQKIAVPLEVMKSPLDFKIVYRTRYDEKIEHHIRFTFWVASLDGGGSLCHEKIRIIESDVLEKGTTELVIVDTMSPLFEYVPESSS